MFNISITINVSSPIIAASLLDKYLVFICSCIIALVQTVACFKKRLPKDTDFIYYTLKKEKEISFHCHPVKSQF